MTDPPTADTPDDGDPPNVQYAKDAWLHRRVLDHVDPEVSGGYSWDEAAFDPVAVLSDGALGLVFAKT